MGNGAGVLVPSEGKEGEGYYLEIQNTTERRPSTNTNTDKDKATGFLKNKKRLDELTTEEESKLIDALCLVYKVDPNRCDRIFQSIQSKAKEELNNEKEEQKRNKLGEAKISNDNRIDDDDDELLLLSKIKSMRVPELKESGDPFYYKLLILHNYIRSFPRHFIPYLENHYLKRFVCDEKGRHLLPIEGKSHSFQQFQEGPFVVKETIEFLKKVQPTSPLSFDNYGQALPSGYDEKYFHKFLSQFVDFKNDKEKPIINIPIREGMSGQQYLYQSSWDHVSDCGRKGLYGHDGSDGSTPKERIERYCDWEGSLGENIGYGTGNDTDFHVGNVIFGLLIDDGVPNRGHRTAMFNPEYHHVGIFSGDHVGHGNMTVLNYANKVGPKVKKLKIPKKLTNIKTLTNDVQEVVQSIKSPKARDHIVRALQGETEKGAEDNNPQSGGHSSENVDDNTLGIFESHETFKSLDIDYNPEGKAEITFWYNNGEGRMLTTTWKP